MFDIDTSNLNFSGKDMIASDISPGTFFVLLNKEGGVHTLFQHVGKQSISSCDDSDVEKILLLLYDLEKPAKATKLNTVYKGHVFHNFVEVYVDIQVSFTNMRYISPKAVLSEGTMFALNSRDGFMEIMTRGDDWNKFGEYVSITRGESFTFPKEIDNKVVPVDLKFIVSMK